MGRTVEPLPGGCTASRVSGPCGAHAKFPLRRPPLKKTTLSSVFCLLASALLLTSLMILTFAWSVCCGQLLRHCRPLNQSSNPQALAQAACEYEAWILERTLKAILLARNSTKHLSQHEAMWVAFPKKIKRCCGRKTLI